MNYQFYFDDYYQDDDLENEEGDEIEEDVYGLTGYEDTEEIQDFHDYYAGQEPDEQDPTESLDALAEEAMHAFCMALSGLPARRYPRNYNGEILDNHLLPEETTSYSI